MKISRRTFLAAAPLAGGLILSFDTVIRGQDGPTLPPYGDGGALAKMTFLTFFENLNTNFEFVNKDRDKIPLTLIAVEDQRPITKRKWGQGQENFMLSFRGPRRFPFVQGTYEIEHFRLGKFSLFITVGGKIEKDLLYNAIINRVDS
jgi:hypothetical protein